MGCILPAVLVALRSGPCRQVVVASVLEKGVLRYREGQLVSHLVRFAQLSFSAASMAMDMEVFFGVW